MTEPETLRGATVVLRALTTLDAPSLFEAYGDPLVLRYWLSAPHRDVDETRRLIEADAGDELVFGIAVGGGPAIGRLTLDVVHPHRRATIGFLIARAHWRRGLAGDALNVALAHAFGPLGLRRVEAYVDTRNEASLRCLQRANFRREGVMRERWQVGDEARDDVVLSVLVHECRADPRPREDPDDARPTPHAHRPAAR